MTSSLFEASWILRAAADGDILPMGLNQGNLLTCLGMSDQMKYFELFLFINIKREILKVKFLGTLQVNESQKGFVFRAFL